MSTRKERVTVTVDTALIEASNNAVAEGRAESLSAWTNVALTERVASERRHMALVDAVGAYEKRFGTISAQELAEQARADRECALVHRANRAKPSNRKTRRGGTHTS